MLHIMLDAYRAKAEDLNDLRVVYEKINRVTNFLSVKTIMPPVLVPYYYGQVKEDDGISAFVMLKGGHFTIHTFPERECYFVDILYDGFVNADKFVDILAKEFPFEFKILNVVDRRFDIHDQAQFAKIDEMDDFGPHYLIKTLSPQEYTMDEMYAFLDKLPTTINMDPIFRPVVITDNVYNPKIYSGITVIAQSHIAFHYYKETKKAYIDIFSCSFINCDNLIREVQKAVGTECESILISRGSKHTQKRTQRDEYISRFNEWQENIRG